MLFSDQNQESRTTARDAESAARNAPTRKSASKQPHRSLNPQVRKSAPRARGGGPWWPEGAPLAVLCSPRTRGWSLDVHPVTRPSTVLPAHAGVVPPLRGSPGRCARAPRARGGGPLYCSEPYFTLWCSPRTRGWSRAGRLRRTGGRVLPAHAGVVPTRTGLTSCGLRAPRARGGGPGGGPSPSLSAMCSPRTRGWSRLGVHVTADAVVLPAHAGVVPARPTVSRLRRGAPRARGGGPFRPARRPSPSRCSPRTRGWSHDQDRVDRDPDVLPAHAGVVPSSPPAAR